VDNWDKREKVGLFENQFVPLLFAKNRYFLTVLNKKDDYFSLLGQTGLTI